MIGEMVINFLKNNTSINKNQEQIIVFAGQLIESTIISISFIIFISLILNNVRETLLVLLASASVRLVSGGAHCGSAIRCAIFSAMIFPLIATISTFTVTYFNLWILLFILSISLLLIIRYAPAESAGKPLVNKDYIKKLYRLSITIGLLVSLLAFFIYKFNNNVAICIALGFLWQAFSISPLGYKFITSMDKALYIVLRR
ncbi:Accessory gene regulator B [Desulfofarcimen acetoxidans DSM 771]|uniref:Accessory gene regulator B n=1 Tax=Desulfofarcimen acetoxidans (strain ATCC 49208 / DSM 771 / KCTC 5769 / VKM B-1644 / 5575) TaxID=485916 RepID=C8W3P5_DESAS|nr:accessory gene regulator B family protein [Desulfofarcimen acetoxidans]ACV63831.1 Accessory gene regulator B [Desulfofarcimen acetoxidans DSM 771]